MKKRFVVILAILTLLLIPAIYADTGPHQGVDLRFYVTYENQEITQNFTAYILAMCDGAVCPNRPIDNVEMCEGGECKFYYYRIERVPPHMLLMTELNGRNYTSDAINFSWRTSPLSYSINISSDGNTITLPYDDSSDRSGAQSYIISFLAALVITIAIELIVLFIFLKAWKTPTKEWKRPIFSLVLTDIISLPLLWLTLGLLAIFVSLNFLALIAEFLISEALVVVFEAYFMHWLNRKIMPLKRAFVLSIVMNAASMILGGIILAVLSM